MQNKADDGLLWLRGCFHKVFALNVIHLRNQYVHQKLLRTVISSLRVT
jgi:hypothetical protein